MLGHGVGVWGSASWRERAVAWLDERLADAGVERTGEVSQPHLRPWATALKAATTSGVVWLKAAGPGTAFEVGLYELLHKASPRHVLAPIATDTDRGWIVLPDGGSPLGEHVSGSALVDALVTVLPRYGQLQRNLMPHADELVALGVADMRAAVMPKRFDEALAVVVDYVQRRGDGAEQTTLRRLAGMHETVARWCEQLAAVPASPSLDHNDLHPWNVLITGGDLATARFYDWGDSVVAHPFASMLVPLTILAEDQPGGFDAPRVRRVRDAYLDAFSDLAPHAELVGALELACQVGKIARTLTWHRAVQALGDGDRWSDAPIQSLTALLSGSHLGGT